MGFTPTMPYPLNLSVKTLIWPKLEPSVHYQLTGRPCFNQGKPVKTGKRTEVHGVGITMFIFNRHALKISIGSIIV